ncbi:MAG: hypothetical protein KGJ13_04525 [Patescibacteria group bacterium]|nr:hypothetical protein [Patescibacteria group bacterium]
MKVPDFRKLTENIPEGKWVTFSSDETRVVSVGDTVDEVLKQAEKEGEKHPTVFRILRQTLLL